MINFLVACEALVNLRLNVTARPHDSKILISLSALPETVIFKKISDQSYFNLIVQFKIVTPILRLVWSNTYGINIGTEA